MIRAIYRTANAGVAVSPSPYNTLMMKLFYPAAPTGSEEEQNSGVIPADASQAPFPVVIFMPGVNVGLEGYQWLAVRLAQAGLVVVTYNWVAEDMPGYVSLTPGVNLAALAPDVYGSQPTSTALAAIRAELLRLNYPSHTPKNPLTGLLDLKKIILGGHSAGGTMALQNCNPRWFSGVAAAFSYAAHTMASTMLGYPPETILPLPDACPCLIMGGTEDGVIAASSGRYASERSHPTTAIERTFHEALKGGREDCYLALLKGANHFTMTYPQDETTGRPFLDWPTTQPEAALRDLVADLILQFINAHIRHQPEAHTALAQMQNDLLAAWINK